MYDMLNVVLYDDFLVMDLKSLNKYVKFCCF